MCGHVRQAHSLMCGVDDMASVDVDEKVVAAKKSATSIGRFTSASTKYHVNLRKPKSSAIVLVPKVSILLPLAATRGSVFCLRRSLADAG